MRGAPLADGGSRPQLRLQEQSAALATMKRDHEVQLEALQAGNARKAGNAAGKSEEAVAALRIRLDDLGGLLGGFSRGPLCH